MCLVVSFNIIKLQLFAEQIPSGTLVLNVSAGE